MSKVQFNTIAGFRSAISSYHDPIDGVAIGKHPRVSALITGVYNNRMPKPRYTLIWDVEIVLQYLSNLHSEKGLSDKLLTFKLTMLLALTAATRASEICNLDIHYLVKHTSGYTFHFSKITKTARRGKPRPHIKYCVFPDNKILCVCHHIDLYLERSKSWRNNENQLLLSFVNPHKAVTTSIVSRWIVEVFTFSVIDTQKFKGHSTRSVSTSKDMVSGVSSVEILKRGHWSNNSTFQKFYHKEIEPSSHSFQSSITKSFEERSLGV